MFLLPSDQTLDSLPSLRRLLSDGLETLFGVQDGERRLTLNGAWPDLNLLAIDLTDVHLDPFRPPSMPGNFASPPSDSPLRAARLALNADPLRVGEAGRLQLTVTASDVEFSCRLDAQNRRWLAPRHVATGHVEATITGHDLEHLFLQGAEQTAATHGVTIQEGNLRLRQANPREVLIEAELVAKKLFVQSHIRLRGRLAVDDQLNILLRDLQCEGHGMMGKLASQFLQPHLNRWGSRPLPVLATILPGVRLQHAELVSDPQDILHARAEFG